MRIYHGSPDIVEVPQLARCKPRNDYGAAFYCTLDKDLACEWACPDCTTGGYVNEYELDTTKLSVLDLDEAPDGVLNWMAVLLANRPMDREWNLGQDAALFLKRYGISLDEYDAVAGYRCDDSYFAIARAFAQGSLTDVQLAAALRLGDLGRQIALRSEAAFGALEFIGAQPVDPRIYGARRFERDANARAAFRALRQEGNPAGKRIHELGNSKHDGKFIHELRQ